MLKCYLVFMLILESVSSVPLVQTYELIHMTDASTETTGSITLKCRNQLAEDLQVDRVIFWLNRTLACDVDLRQRPDVQEIIIDIYSIMFNLTGGLEGTFTCGSLVIQDNNRIIVRESAPKTLICKYIH